MKWVGDGILIAKPELCQNSMDHLSPGEVIHIDWCITGCLKML